MIAIDIGDLGERDRSYFTWTPSPIHLTLPAGAPGRVSVTLRNGGEGGRLTFTVGDAASAEALDLDLMPGETVTVSAAGRFGHASQAYGDAVIEVSDKTGAVLASRSTMVRVRKDAVTLTPAERDLFLSALGRLNDGGRGRFSDFRDMHTALSRRQAHGNSAFLPWHRAYLLDLERELQAIEPDIALPYWRFDTPAPGLFTREFLGEAGPQGRLRFAPEHPLGGWVTDQTPGIVRLPRFPVDRAPSVLSETDTLILGAPDYTYADFIGMEGDPHGGAHVSFSGPINQVPTAARDPLFFLLHANVDRLWAKWQWLRRRMSAEDEAAYAAPEPDMDGHRLDDSMWPWNGVTGGDRPPTAPGGELAASPMTAAPGARPRVRDMIDYQGAAGGPALAFAYDDVPFERQ